MFTFTEAVILVNVCVHYLGHYFKDVSYRDFFTLISRKILYEYIDGKRFLGDYMWSADDWYNIPNDYLMRPLSISYYNLKKIRMDLTDYFHFIEYCPPHKHGGSLYPSYRLDFNGMLLHDPDIIKTLRALDLPTVHDIPNISAVLSSKDSNK